MRARARVALLLNGKRNRLPRAMVPIGQMARRPFPPSLILLRFSWAGEAPCAHCGKLVKYVERDTWHADHFNGNDDNSDANLQILCVACHAKKTAIAAFGARAASPTHQQTAPATAAANAIYEAWLRPLPVPPPRPSLLLLPVPPPASKPLTRSPLLPFPVPPPRSKPALSPLEVQAIAFGAAYAYVNRKPAPLPPPRGTPPPPPNPAAFAAAYLAHKKH